MEENTKDEAGSMCVPIRALVLTRWGKRPERVRDHLSTVSLSGAQSLLIHDKSHPVTVKNFVPFHNPFMCLRKDKRRRVSPGLTSCGEGSI